MKGKAEKIKSLKSHRKFDFINKERKKNTERQII